MDTKDNFNNENEAEKQEAQNPYFQSDDSNLNGQYSYGEADGETYNPSEPSSESESVYGQSTDSVNNTPTEASSYHEPMSQEEGRSAEPEIYGAGQSSDYAQNTSYQQQYPSAQQGEAHYLKQESQYLQQDKPHQQYPSHSAQTWTNQQQFNQYPQQGSPYQQQTYTAQESNYPKQAPDYPGNNYNYNQPGHNPGGMHYTNSPQGGQQFYSVTKQNIDPLSVVSLSVSIVAALLMFFSFTLVAGVISIILGIVGIICGAIAMRNAGADPAKSGSKNMALAGIIVSAVAVFISLISVIACYACYRGGMNGFGYY